MLFKPEISEGCPSTSTNNTLDWWKVICPEKELDNLEHSGKLVLLFSILSQCSACGDKLLVFSQSLITLDLIEKFLAMVTEDTRKRNLSAQLAGFSGKWVKGTDYFRLDGSTNIKTRKEYCEVFNNETNTEARFVTRHLYMFNILCYQLCMKFIS